MSRRARHREKTVFGISFFQSPEYFQIVLIRAGGMPCPALIRQNAHARRAAPPPAHEARAKFTFSGYAGWRVSKAK
jgi:hypothetical protein